MFHPPTPQVLIHMAARYPLVAPFSVHVWIALIQVQGLALGLYDVYMVPPLKPVPLDLSNQCTLKIKVKRYLQEKKKKKKRESSKDLVIYQQ